MMTDKATVEMESPVAGKVVEVAGEVGDQSAIGSVLVVFETSAEAAEAAAETEETVASADVEDRRSDDRHAGEDRRAEDRGEADRRQGDRRAEPPLPQAGGDEPRSGERGGAVASTTSPPPAPPASGRGVLASPAVRQRARDLGIDLGQVQTTCDRIRHADLDSYLLYKGGAVPRPGAAARRQDEQIKVVGLRRKIAENMQAAKRHPKEIGRAHV